MNNFKKEELRQIHEILVDVCRQWIEPDSTYELRNKIQSMIDNYCEHESLFSIDENKHCCKCGEWFNDNQ